MAGTGHNSFAKTRLRSYFERIERLQEEIDALNTDKSEVYTEAKAEGFDVKVMKVVLSRRQMDRADVEERDALIKFYEDVMKGLPGGAGTDRATRARAEDGDE